MDHALWHATKLGDPDTVARLLAMNADFRARDSEGKTILHCAADWGKAAVVYLLIKWGADVNALDKTYKTPLHQAACWGHTDVMKILLRAGARVNAQDFNGYTPLHYAASMSNAEAVRILLMHGGEPLILARDGRDVHSLATSGAVKGLLANPPSHSTTRTNSSTGSSYMAFNLHPPGDSGSVNLHPPGDSGGGWKMVD